MTVRRLFAGLGVLAGAAGCTAFLLCVSHGMRDVLVTDGGVCASGGPYVTAQQCSSGDMRLLLVGILAGLVCAAIYAIGTAGLGQSASQAGLVTWTALFGLLGWNFISLHGSLVTGVVFWVMAFGGLVLALMRLASGLREAGRPGPALGGSGGAQPLVRAVIPPGLAATGWQPGDLGGWLPGGGGGVSDVGGSVGGSGGSPASPGRAGVIASVVAWLVASLVGAAVGIAVSAPLISLLK